MASTQPKSSLIIQHHNWSDLPMDLLQSISTKLSLSDFLSFKRVCTSWHIVTREISVPRLVFFSKPRNKIDAKVLCLGINEGKHRSQKERSPCLEHPHASNKVIGSHPEGWLLFSDTKGHIFLMELLANVRIDLPKIVKRSILYHKEILSHKSILSDNPNRRQDFIAIMLYGNRSKKKLAFWRNGDSKWSPLQGDKADDYTDIAWSNDTLYALKGYDSVEIWDLHRNGIHSNLPTKKFSIFPVQSYWEVLNMAITKLVVSSTGEVLVVADKYMAEKWVVYKVDLNKERCVHVETLNGQALVMVPLPDQIWSCLSLDNVNNYGYKPNSIYLATWKCTYGRKIKLSNYSLEDGKLEEVWVSNVPFDEHVKLQPLGMFSLDTTVCKTHLEDVK